METSQHLNHHWSQDNCTIWKAWLERPAYGIVQVPPGDLCLRLCCPFGNAYLPLEPKRTYCFQKIRKPNSASGRNGISSAFYYFHISRNRGTLNGVHILKEISSLNEDVDYIKVLMLYSSLCSYGKNNTNAFTHCCTSSSIFEQQTVQVVKLGNPLSSLFLFPAR